MDKFWAENLVTMLLLNLESPLLNDLIGTSVLMDVHLKSLLQSRNWRLRRLTLKRKGSFKGVAKKRNSMDLSADFLLMS